MAVLFKKGNVKMQRTDDGRKRARNSKTTRLQGTAQSLTPEICRDSGLPSLFICPPSATGTRRRAKKSQKKRSDFILYVIAIFCNKEQRSDER